MFGKIIAYIGFAISFVSIIAQNLSTIQSMFWIACVVVCCFLIEAAFNWICNLNYEWLDTIFYKLDKNPNDFKIKNKIITFDIKSKSEARYDVEVDVIQLKNDDNIIYQGRYCWSQETDINHTVVLNGKILDVSKYEIGENIKWSTVTVFPVGIIHKGDKNKVEYSLENLHIDNIKYHRFLSCKVIEKIVDLKLNIKIPIELSGQNKAEFLVENHKGEVIYKEDLSAIGKFNEYTRTIHKPRIGRKYIIKIS